MKRSRSITLTLLTSATVLLTSCNSDQQTKREVYRDKTACVQDWGEEQKCEPAPGGGYYGPHYFWHSGRPYYFPRRGGEPEPLRTGRMATLSPGGHSPNAVSSLSGSIRRGGFGHFASFHGSGS